MAQNRPMGRARTGAASVLMIGLQTAVLLAVGLGIGIVHRTVSPPKAVPERSVGASSAGTQTRAAAQPTRPTQPTTVVQPGAEPAPAQAEPRVEPAQGPTVVAVPTQPAATQAFVPTPESELKFGHITIDTAVEMRDFMGALFLDARNEQEYADGHIDGARYSGLNAMRSGRAPEILRTLEKDHPIVVYCSTSKTCSAAEEVATLLQVNAGFTNVHVLYDGMIGWEAMGHPVTRGGGQ